MQPYIPSPLPLSNLDYKMLLGLVGTANAELARYDGLLQGIVNPSLMLSPLTTQEAVLSSKIEGTQATIDEVLEQEAGLEKTGEKYNDIREIINYRVALSTAHDYLRERPITLGFILELHKILMDSVRGKEKNPGEFRKDQNWIGTPGTPIEQATFVPPSPLQLMDHLEAWQQYIEGTDIDQIFQVAVIHAQFELIHPFKDGNGRIGRILIPLVLFRKNKISQPMFYLSAYLENNRDEYYSRLCSISQEGDWNGWIAFFMKAVSQQAIDNCLVVKSIMKLYEDMKGEIQALTHSQFTIQLLDAIFNRPIFKTSDFIKETGIHKPTAMGLLRQLKLNGVLKELRAGRGRRAGVLCFPRLLSITEKHNLSR